MRAPSKAEASHRIDTTRLPILLRLIWYWLPVPMMFGVMYYFSTDVFSADNTRSVIEKVFLWFVPHASHHALARFNFVIRKSAHFFEYAILGVLLFRAFRSDSPTRWRFRWALYSLFSAVSWALLDEYHQTLTQTRGGSIWDSLLDSSGALFSLIVIALYSTRHHRNESLGAELKAVEK